jgi:DNA primase
MSQAALSAGHSLTYLLKTGLTREKDGSPYDFFRGRVMFPIHNVSGKVIAFGGRTLKAEKDIAKYFNSPESDLYHKSNTLYGLHLAKNAMVKEDNCFLVEGYTDVIALHQAGVENVVASSGTSLTEGQIRLIRRFTQNITILYDGDKAGIKASFRGIDMILKEGLNVRVSTFPDGDDPDSYSRKHSSEEIQLYVKDNAKDFIRYKTALLLEEVGNDPIKKAGLIRGIVDSIALIPDAIKRSVFVQDCSQIMGIGESVLFLELNKSLQENLKKGPGKPTSSEEGGVHTTVEAPVPTPFDETAPVADTLNAEAQERDFLRILLMYGEYEMPIEIVNEEGKREVIHLSVADYLIGNLEHDFMTLQSEVYSKMLKEYLELVKDNQMPSHHNFTSHEEESVRSEAVNVLTTRHQISENWKTKHGILTESEEYVIGKAAKDCLFRMKMRHVQIAAKAIESQLEGESNEDEVMILLAEKKRLDEVRKQLADNFGTVVL